MLRNAAGDIPGERRARGNGACALGAVAALVALTLLLAAPSQAIAETLDEALAATYGYNPRIDAERATLRATDEGVARAMSGYRPSINGQADVGRQRIDTRPPSAAEGTLSPRGYAIQLTQPIFRGFRTTNAVNQAEADVRAGREILRNVEQQVLLDAVEAYMDVVRDQEIVRLRENNLKVLSEELRATQDRFAVGEVTKTDVAQSEARRAGAVAQLDFARASVKSSRARYQQVVGHQPGSVSQPRLKEEAIPKSLDDAIAIGTNENPNVVTALYREQSARFAVDLVRGELLPELQLEATYQDRFSSSQFIDEQETAIIAGRLNVPIYDQGGEVYARVRQAKHAHVSLLQEIEVARVEVQAQIVAAWSQLLANRAQIVSAEAQVDANQTALAGVREEERVGQRTLIDVLNAQQELLDSQVNLTTARRDLIVTAYQLQVAIGHLDAVGLGVTGLVYDPEEHYFETRRKWIGTSITPGRVFDTHDGWGAVESHEPSK